MRRSTHSGRAALVDALNTLAQSIAHTLGFSSAVISIAFEDVMEAFGVASPEDIRANLKRHRMPLNMVEKELANAEVWGDLRFVPHERVQSNLAALGRPTGPVEVPGDSSLWHPLDMLVAPIEDAQGNLRGVVSLDGPLDGRRPHPEVVERVHQQLALVRRTVTYAIERVELDEQIRMTQAVRQVVREASRELSVDSIIERSYEALTTTFNANGLWIQTFDDSRDGSGLIYAATGERVELGEDLRRIARPAARSLWKYQSVAVLAESNPRSWALPPEDERLVFAFMREVDITSMLFVPLGAGLECLGNLVLTRRGGRTSWTPLEKRTALDIGHDLGRALLNARSFEREKRAVDELRELDSYKSRLVATLAHELKNPLTAVLGHTEILQGAGLDEAAEASVRAVERGAARMERLVEDLLALAKAADPQTDFSPERVDLRAVVDEVVDLLRVTSDRKGIDLDVTSPHRPVMVMGDPVGLDKVVSNLVSNAVKYTQEGGRVEVSIRRERDEVAVRVRDSGMGISEEDQKRLFEEFFRSTNPHAVEQPGTGLGLAIAKRIVERHSGTIKVDSTLGHGTVFTVTLPALG